MNREQANELKEVFNAFCKGKQIQCLQSDGTWFDWNDWDFSSLPEHYRIKPTEERHNCKDCKWRLKSTGDSPCRFCIDGNKWEQEEKKEPAYRPFKDCDELIKKSGQSYRPENTMPLIWVREKESRACNLITGYDDENYVFLQDRWIDMEVLFNNFEFLDGEPCGKEEE